MAGDKVKISGKAQPGGNRWVTVRVGGKKVKTVRTRKDGSFRLAGALPVPASTRPTRCRAPAAPSVRARAAARSTPTAPRTRPTTGQACTGTAPRAARRSPSTVGVANKSLPCGTKVIFHYGGRTVKARVIDRGPYAGNREWDLTSALKAKLGFGTTGKVLSTR